MSEQQNETTVKRWVEILGRWGADPADLPRALDLIDPDCEWVIMATGERFPGADAIRKMAGSTAESISHSQEHKLKVTNLFVKGDRGCLEYVHGALLRLPGKSEPTPIEMPICIVFHFKNGKIDHAQEYYEVLQMQGPGSVKPVYAES